MPAQTSMASSQILFGSLRDRAPELGAVSTEQWATEKFEAGAGACPS